MSKNLKNNSGDYSLASAASAASAGVPATTPPAAIKAAGKTIYIEKEVRDHPRSQAIIKHFGNPCVIECDSHREIFNPKRNSFALQKKHPALIIARKHKGHVQVSPYGLGGKHNFYFSHMLNCIYNCSYCFLQGMYSSAHHVLFVNYEDFFSAIEEQIAKHLEKAPNEECYFFSGYDCDSLAYEPVSHFVENALPFFAKHPQAYLELRTKSVQTTPLLKTKPIGNCIVAFSMAPQDIADEYEEGVPSPAKRIAAMKQLAANGWLIGVRLDPLIWHDNWQANYSGLIDDIAAAVPEKFMHSVTLGTLRFPRSMVAAVREQHPTAKFLVERMITSDKALSMQPDSHEEITDFCYKKLASHYASHKIIPNEV
ncbi:MAG: DNA photolyase [Gammaproteobacteria bacterium]|nr:DNA photolyase [Gammaproteobacteria bacterium]